MDRCYTFEYANAFKTSSPLLSFNNMLNTSFLTKLSKFEAKTNIIVFLMENHIYEQLYKKYSIWSFRGEAWSSLLTNWTVIRKFICLPLKTHALLMHADFCCFFSIPWNDSWCEIFHQSCQPEQSYPDEFCSLSVQNQSHKDIVQQVYYFTSCLMASLMSLPDSH